MTHEESMAEADRILRAAGWTPARTLVTQGGSQIANTEGRFAVANLVCGHPPPGASAVFAAKELSKVPQCAAEAMGLDPADYPDEPHEAAEWLVRHFGGAPFTVSQETLTEHQSEALDGDGPDLGAGAGVHGDGSESDADLAAGGEDKPTAAGPGGAFEESAIDADFGELDPADDALDLGELDDYALDPLLLEGEADEANVTPPEPEPEYQGQDRFIGLDDLDRRRSLRIGDVIRYARQIMPFWTTDHDTALRELRNFAMGVQEGRWADDPARREELMTLEATAAHIRRIEAARDAKVEFLEQASRDEIEAFDVEADWP